MISIRSISLWYKTAAVFSLLALVLSLITGFIAGIRWEVVLLRSAILMLVFAGIGFGASAILRKFVPEVYQLLSSLAGEGQAAGSGEPDIGMEEVGAEMAGAGESAPAYDDASGVVPPEAPAGDFAELEKEGLAHYSTASGETAVHTRSGKLGKHILEKEKMAKYEPKIMAQAVRTMMIKDRD
jgi:hypothetical protein